MDAQWHECCFHVLLTHNITDSIVHGSELFQLPRLSVKIIIYWWLAISLLAIYTRETETYTHKRRVYKHSYGFPHSSTKLGEKQTSTERWTNKQTVNIHAQQVKKWTTGITENGWKHTMLSERTETQKGTHCTIPCLFHPWRTKLNYGESKITKCSPLDGWWLRLTKGT